MEKLIWHVEKRIVKNLVRYDRNPRKISDFMTQKLTEGLKKFNLVEIPAIDTNNRIIAGHQRMKIMIALGRADEEIDVRVPNRALTEDEFKEYNIRSNLNVGTWDFNLLAEIDESFLAEIGFSSEELDDIFDVDPTPEVFDMEKELQKLKIDQILFQKQDIYDCDGCRLMCSDSTIVSTCNFYSLLI